MNRKFFILSAAGLAGLLGVVLGALGAHAWAEILAGRGQTQTWSTALHFWMWHTLALLIAGLSHRPDGPFPFFLRWAVFGWLAGILTFSGSIFLLALGGPRWLGPVTPLGGLCLIAGWIFLILHAWQERSPAHPSTAA